MNNHTSHFLQGVVFDIDGVIFDSRAANIGYYNLIRQSIGLSPMSAEDEEFCHMASSIDSFDRIIPPHLQDLAHKATKTTRYNDYVLPRLTLEKGLVELLSWLKIWNVRLGICTNRANRVEHLLHHFGIDMYFSVIKTAGNCTPKPSPQGLLEILSEWDVAPGYVAFIGDTSTDYLAAQGAKVHFWAFKNTALNAEMHFSDFFSMIETIKPLVEQDISLYHKM